MYRVFFPWLIASLKSSISTGFLATMSIKCYKLFWIISSNATAWSNLETWDWQCTPSFYVKDTDTLLTQWLMGHSSRLFLSVPNEDMHNFLSFKTKLHLLHGFSSESLGVFSSRSASFSLVGLQKITCFVVKS